MWDTRWKCSLWSSASGIVCNRPLSSYWRLMLLAGRQFLSMEAITTVELHLYEWQFVCMCVYRLFARLCTSECMFVEVCTKCLRPAKRVRTFVAVFEMWGENEMWMFLEMEQRNELKTVPIFSTALAFLHVSHNAYSFESLTIAFFRSLAHFQSEFFSVHHFPSVFPIPDTINCRRSW